MVCRAAPGVSICVCRWAPPSRLTDDEPDAGASAATSVTAKNASSRTKRGRIWLMARKRSTNRCIGTVTASPERRQYLSFATFSAPSAG